MPQGEGEHERGLPALDGDPYRGGRDEGRAPRDRLRSALAQQEEQHQEHRGARGPRGPPRPVRSDSDLGEHQEVRQPDCCGAPPSHPLRRPAVGPLRHQRGSRGRQQHQREDDRRPVVVGASADLDGRDVGVDGDRGHREHPSAPGLRGRADLGVPSRARRLLAVAPAARTPRERGQDGSALGLLVLRIAPLQGDPRPPAGARGQGRPAPDRLHPGHDGVADPVAQPGWPVRVEAAPRVGDRHAHRAAFEDQCDAALGGPARVRGVGARVEADVVERLVARVDERGARLGGERRGLLRPAARDRPVRFPGSHLRGERAQQLLGLHGPAGGGAGGEGAQGAVRSGAHLALLDAAVEREDQC